MVSLGFIRNSENCPPEARQIRVMSAAEPMPAPGEATVRIWRDARGVTRWGLDWSVRDPSDAAKWAPLLAGKLVSLDWRSWWLDLACLSETLGLPADKALAEWGARFWPVYTHDALVLLDVEGRRRTVYQVVRRWEQQYAGMRFSTRHDYDGQLTAP